MMEPVKRGTKPKVIFGALDHSSATFTMDAYFHIIGGHARRSYGEGCPSG
jgi:hypothetical protein